MKPEFFNRKGTVKLSREFIKRSPDKAIKILSEILVVRAENDFITDTVTYWGYSNSFDECEKSVMPPEYLATFDNLKNVEFSRKREEL